MARAGIVAVALLLVGACRAPPSAQAAPPSAQPAPPSTDPFGALPLPASPNCGPERRYKVEVTISSKEDLARFLDTTKIDSWVTLYNFRDPSSGRLDAAKVIAATDVRQLGGRTIYALDYQGGEFCIGQKHTVKVTSDGHVSVYGCCGQ